jgi:hypothetical protein
VVARVSTAGVGWRILILGALGQHVYRVVRPCVGRGASPRLYNCNLSLGIN